MRFLPSEYLSSDTVINTTIGLRSWLSRMRKQAP